jgi:hypothetical protein
MRLTFIFTDSPDLSTLSRNNLYTSYFDLPETVLQLPDAKEQVLSLAGRVGQLTRAALHLSCKELDLNNHPIKLTVEKNYVNERFDHHFWNTVICFHAFLLTDR